MSKEIEECELVHIWIYTSHGFTIGKTHYLIPVCVVQQMQAPQKNNGFRPRVLLQAWVLLQLPSVNFDPGWTQFDIEIIIDRWE